MARSSSVEDKALALTGVFEGGGLTGNFDDQFLSWGPLQWNAGRGTLRPLLLSIHEQDAEGFARVVGAAFMAAILESDDAFIAFIKTEILNAAGLPRKRWRGVFSALEELPGTQVAWREHAVSYLDNAELDCVRLGFVSERAFAFCFDVSVQNGGLRMNHITTYWERMRRDLSEEWMRLKILAYIVADNSLPRWREDVLARKLTIAVRTGIVHDQRVDIYQDFGISHLVPWREA